MSLKDQKRKLVQLMIQKQGVQFTIGWLTQAYVVPDNPASEPEIVESTLRWLEAQPNVES